MEQWYLLSNRNAIFNNTGVHVAYFIRSLLTVSTIIIFYYIIEMRYLAVLEYMLLVLLYHY